MDVIIASVIAKCKAPIKPIYVLYIDTLILFLYDDVRLSYCLSWYEYDDDDRLWYSLVI